MHPLLVDLRNSQHQVTLKTMKTIFTFLAMSFVLLIPASYGFGQEQEASGSGSEAAVENPVLYVMVIESLPRSNAHNRFIHIKSVFSDVFEAQDWPVSEIKVVRFGSDTPDDALVLKVFVMDWRIRIGTRIEFRCALELKHDGERDKLGIVVGKHETRPLLGSGDQEEAYDKSAEKAAELIVEKLNDNYFSDSLSE